MTSLPHDIARERRAFWLFMLIALVVLGAGIGQRDPWPSDEPRFTLSAKQMVESGDWLFPHRGSELYSDKPPVLMWAEAASYEVTRHWRIAFLLPSLLAGLLTLGLVYDLGRRLWNPRVGLYAAGALLATFQFVYQFKRAQIDPVVTAWITLANWGLLLHLLRGPNWRAFWLGCFAAGLGVITKGVGVLALLMLLPYAYARRRRWPDVTVTSRSTLDWLAGALAFVAPVALWVVPMVMSARVHGTPAYAAYVQDILFHQTAGRYAHSWDHAHSALYYVPILLFSWIPLSLAYPGTFPRWWRAIKAQDARILLPLAWSVLVVVFFCIPKGKRDVYLMPALPMIALVSAPYLEELVRTRWLRITALVFALVIGALITIGAVLALTGSPAAERLLHRDLPDMGHALWYVVLAMGVAMLASCALFRVRRGVHAIVAGFVAIWMIWGFFGYPILNDASSAAGVMRRVNETIGADAELGMVAWKEQNLLMVDRPVTDFGFTVPWPEQFSAAVRWQAEAPARRWIFALDKAMGHCVDRSKAISVGHANRRDWWLFRADAVIPGCVPETATGADANDDSAD